jgi:WD40 repeat protein
MAGWELSMNTRPNPYIGPDSFETGDTLYGRDRELRQLEALLIAERIVLLHSPSGAGKTSLIRAGLLPLLKDDFLILPTVRVNQVRPTDGEPVNRYLWSTLLSLEENLLESERRPLAELAALSLDAYLRSRPRPATAPDVDLLIFDQFEEILTIAPADQQAKHAFFEQLAAALKERNRWVLFAVREDYLGALAPYLRPMPNRLKTTFRLDLLKTDAAREAIQRPPLAQGVSFNETAADQLVRDLSRIQTQDVKGATREEQGEYVEPVQLQVVCFNLWQNLDDEASEISVADLSTVGSVDESLAQYYAASLVDVAAKTGASERDLRTWFDKQLLTGSAEQPVRGQVRKGAGSTEGLQNAALDKLVDAHIIRAEPRAGAIWYELAHDRLIQPVRSSNLGWFEQNLSVFQRRAELWNQQGHSEGLLLRGKELINAQQEVKSLHLTPDESAFLGACRKLRAQQQFRRTAVIGLIGFSIVTLGLLIFALIQFNISRAQQLGFQSQVAFTESDYNTAFLYAYQSNLIHKNDAADFVLSQIPYKNFALGKSLNGSASIDSLAWSADGQLASSSANGYAIIWNIKTGQPAQFLDIVSNTMAWSTDGRLASGLGNGDGSDSVVIWDIKTDQAVQTLKGHTGHVTSVAWSADGQVASASDDGTVIIWDLKTGQAAQTLKGRANGDTSLAWSADGQLASGQNGTVIIWDLKTGQTAQMLKGDIIYGGTSVAWSADGQLASAGSDDGTVIIWDIKTGQPAQILRVHTKTVTSVAWSADGQLASGSEDNTIIIWDLKTGQAAQTLKGHTRPVNNVAWSADGQLASGSDDGTVIIWNVKTYKTLLEGIDGFNEVAWSTDTLLGTGGQLASSSLDNTVVIWDLKTGLPAQTLKDRTNIVTALAWSADGRLASGSGDNTVIIWDIKTGQAAQVLKGPHSGANPTNTITNNSVISVAWSADGRLASAGLDDGTVIIWNLKTGQPAQILKGHTTIVDSVAWSPDGQLASGSWDNTVIIWDLKTGQPAQTLRGHTGLVSSVAWSADGRLASGSDDGTVIIWDIKTGQPAQTLKGYTGLVSSVAWSADGQLASGSQDGTVIIWDIETGQPAQTLKGHTDYVSSLAWSTDGRLASGSRDRTIKISRADLTGGSRCEKIVRNMTMQEWLDYQGVFFVYQPACPNLYDPTVEFDLFEFISDPFGFTLDPPGFTSYGSPLRALITWQGRAILFVLLLILIGVFIFIAWMFRKSIAWIWHRIHGRKSKNP